MRERNHKQGLNASDLALLAHEVRGALTIINGYSELLRRDLTTQDRTMALNGVTHAVERVDQMLMSALEGTFGVHAPTERIALADLAEAVAAEHRAISDRHIEVYAETNPVVLGSTDAIERALANLITNSLKYSLRGSIVEVLVGEEGPTAVLAVADRGPGIPDAEKERMLEPFARLDVHESLPGTGLGLTVVSGVAEQHGGRVLILDRPGGGTLVRMEFPKAD